MEPNIVHKQTEIMFQEECWFQRTEENESSEKHVAEVRIPIAKHQTHPTSVRVLPETI